MNRILTGLLALTLVWGFPLHADAQTNKRRSDSSQKAKATATANKDTTTSKTTAAKNDATTDSAESTSAAVQTLAAGLKSSAAGISRPGRNAVVVRIEGLINERGDTLVFLSEDNESLKDYVDLLRRLREDSSVQTVVLKIGSNTLSTAQVQELTDSIIQLRDRKKKTVALLEDDSQPSYLLAAACDEVVMPPSGEISLTGVKADAYFVRDMLAKIGVKIDIVHMGQYKSFGEMFTEDKMTSPARQNLTEIVDDVYDGMTSSIATLRKMDVAKVQSIIDGGPLQAADAKTKGLVDDIAYADELFKRLERKGLEVETSDKFYKSEKPKLDDVNMFSILMGGGLGAQSSRSSDSRSSRLPQVAVVYAIGEINVGSSDGPIVDNEQILSEDFLKIFDEIQKDPKIKAVILRVNSPGGSAFASDLLWRKIQDLRKTKPVVASMSEVAASGGYYISMGATRIVAQPGTLTGSIGVVGGKVSMASAFEKLGISKESISRGKYANLFDETTTLSPDQRALIESSMKKVYDDFTSKAAEGRRMSREKLHELAQGRVWTGKRAQEVGLVDEIGGIARAIAITKDLIGVSQDDKVALVSYPKEMNFLDMLQKALGGGMAVSSTQPHIWALLARELNLELPRVVRQSMNAMMQLRREQVLAVMPMVPVVR